MQDDPIIIELPAELWLHILKFAVEPSSTTRVDLDTEEEHRVAFNSAMQLRRVNKLFRLLSRDFQVCHLLLEQEHILIQFTWGVGCHFLCKRPLFITYNF